MKKRIFIIASYVSDPSTMGGNTKIILELINNAPSTYKFIILTSEPETFSKLTNLSIELIDLNFHFKKMSYFSHFFEINFMFFRLIKYFKKFKINTSDYVYTVSDFWPDVLPVIILKPIFKFKTIFSLFLFIPDPVNNLFKKYQFPFIKYIIYFIYQRIIFFLMKFSANYFLITNESDFKYFPEDMHQKILAIYGGVNIEQIPKSKSLNKKYDAVYCGRLHEQKGLIQLLKIWKKCIQLNSSLKLAIIGNGEKYFELKLKNYANKLGINKNIDWLGYVNNHKKYRIYNQSKVLVHTSVYDNNGMVAAESLCSGLPVIMNDLPELKSIYTTGCIKIENSSIEKYAKMLYKLIMDEKFRNKIAPKNNDINQLRKFWAWESRSKLFYKLIS